jgi:hypothetical protein
LLGRARAALPTLDIAEGALDKIFALYKELVPGLGGYLTAAGQLQAGRLEALLGRLAALEQETLEQRAAVRTGFFGGFAQGFQGIFMRSGLLEAHRLLFASMLCVLLRHKAQRSKCQGASVCGLCPAEANLSARCRV